MNLPWRSMTHEERLRWFISHWRRLVPFLFVLCAAFLMTMPVFASLPVLPHFALLAVYVWVVFQPWMMPAWLGLPIGMITDILTGMPLGANATLMPVMILSLTWAHERLGPRSYSMDWLMLFPVSLVYIFLLAKLLDFTGTPVSMIVSLVQICSTTLAYPALAWACVRVHRHWVNI